MELIGPRYDHSFEEGLGKVHSYRFKGPKKPKAPPRPSLGDMGNSAQRSLYNRYQNVLNFNEPMVGANIHALNQQDISQGRDNAYRLAGQDLNSYLNRFIPKTDYDLKEKTRDQFQQGYYRDIYDNSINNEMQKYDDYLQAQEAGHEMLAGEKRMAVQNASLWNEMNMQNQALQNQYGSFGGNLAYGLANAGGRAAMYFSQGMAGNAQSQMQINPSVFNGAGFGTGLQGMNNAAVANYL